MLLIAMVAATSLLSGASLRSGSAAVTLIGAYVFLVAELALVTNVLSPLHLVTRGGLAGAEAVVLAISVAVWWLRGRPGLGLRQAADALRVAVADRIVMLFLLAVAAGLAYELVLVFTVPANNWDSLTYHLTRAAAWTQHQGVFWVPHAPTDRINEFQPLAEQEVLFLFVSTGKGALFALPQFVAQIGILMSVYRIAVRLGSPAGAAACAAAMFATLAVVAEEATTSQNDLVATSLAVAAVALLLEETTATAVLAGIAIALGLGVKLTTALVLPVVVVLAARRGRRRSVLIASGAIAGFLVLSLWGFVLNVVHTDHVLGHGGGRTEVMTSPSYPDSVVTLFKLSYRLLDVSGYPSRDLWIVTALGIAAACALVVTTRTSRGSGLGTARIWSVVALLLPGIVLLVGSGVHTVADALSTNIVNAPNRRANEDYSAFGPVGAVALAATIATCLWRRDTGRDRKALAASLPLFLLLLALSSKYNAFLARFLIVPAAVTAPLFADLFRRRTITLALAAVSVFSLATVLLHNELKPLEGRYGRPWSLSHYEAVALTWQSAASRAARQLDRTIPSGTRLGAILGSDAPAYLLYGSSLDRDVHFLPRTGSAAAACDLGLRYVVVDDASQTVLRAFPESSWRAQPLTESSPPYWTLLVRAGGGCDAQ